MVRTVSVIMPVYNEADLLVPAVSAVNRFLEARPQWQYEILIVESGSTDATGAIADQVAASDPRVRVVHEGAKRGFGSAVRLAYAHARSAFVLLLTSVLTFRLVELYILVY
jgi:dolichol-phosphate mannosyltransferase